MKDDADSRIFAITSTLTHLFFMEAIARREGRGGGNEDGGVRGREEGGGWVGGVREEGGGEGE